MAGYKPRRPAQLNPEQIELIEGNADTAYNSELAHTSAQAIVPLPAAGAADAEVIARISQLIQDSGVDVIAEAWVDSPADSLPGILWRGFLLREWIRRYPQVVQERYAGAESYFAEKEPERIAQITSPTEVKEAWDEVFCGNFLGDFARVLRISARLMDYLGSVIPIWIKSDADPLATEVTRRDTALLRTAGEFRQAGELLTQGLLS